MELSPKYILGHKASLNKFKKIEITLWILPASKGITLGINSKRNYRKNLKNMQNE
jgi:hypothetical protein